MSQAGGEPGQTPQKGAADAKDAADPTTTQGPQNGSTALTKERLDYAWKWFAYHADQRVKLFNYMFVATGILATGAASALKPGEENFLIAGILSFLGLCLGLSFRQLDKRNSTLVWYGEDVLRQIEREELFHGQTLHFAREVGGTAYRFEAPMGILNREVETKIAALKSAQEHGKSEAKIDTAVFSPQSIKRAFDGKHRFWLPFSAYGVMALFGALFIYVIAAACDQPCALQPFFCGALS